MPRDGSERKCIASKRAGDKKQRPVELQKSRILQHLTATGWGLYQARNNELFQREANSLDCRPPFQLTGGQKREPTAGKKRTPIERPAASPCQKSTDWCGPFLRRNHGSNYQAAALLSTCHGNTAEQGVFKACPKRWPKPGEAMRYKNKRDNRPKAEMISSICYGHIAADHLLNRASAGAI